MELLLGSTTRRQVAKPQLTPAFHRLALDLARNHVFSSVPWERFGTVCDRLLASRQTSAASPDLFPPRVVVVLGAGASAAGCDLPLGPAAGELLAERLTRVNKDVLAEEVTRLRLEYHLNASDFETTLLALNKYDPTRLLDELTNVFGRRFYPSVCYELLAHMMKHRFIDAIINFNFDETLDQSLDDEIGRGNYDRVTGDGDGLSEIEALARERSALIRPLYIKPHGTASHKSSMRFTRNSYSLLSAELGRLVGGLLAARPTKLIVIGHAMKSIEFNKILDDNASTVEVFVMDRELPESPLAAPGRFQTIGKDDGALDAAVLALWRQVERTFHRRKPRDVERHNLIPRLFGSKVDVSKAEGNRNLQKYFHDRTIVELALAIAKAKGFINVRELASGRAGVYFRLFSKKAGGESLQKMCANLGLRHVGYSAEVMSLEEPRSDFASGTSSLIVSPADFERSAATSLANRAVSHLLDPSRIHKHRRAFELTLCKMYEGAEVEVQHSYDLEGHEVFQSPVSLHTLTALRAQTLEMLESPTWDALVCVAETGQWLTNEDVTVAIRARGARLGLIVADTTYRKKIEGIFGDQVKGRLTLLPWWLHNRHLTLLLKNGVPVQGIYFERRLRASTVMPLLLSSDDAKPLLDWYVAYLIKATRYRAQSHEGVITKEDVDLERSRLVLSLKQPAGKPPPRSRRRMRSATASNRIT
jgi:hypothetical protein